MPTIHRMLMERLDESIASLKLSTRDSNDAVVEFYRGECKYAITQLTRLGYIDDGEASELTQRVKLAVKSTSPIPATESEVNQGTKLLSAKELAEIVGNKTLAYSLFHREGFPTIRIGKRVFVRSDSFYKWLESQEQ